MQKYIYLQFVISSGKERNKALGEREKGEPGHSGISEEVRFATKPED